VELLRQARLLEVVLPESKAFDVEDQEAHAGPYATAWNRTLSVLDALEQPTFSVALAALVRELGDRDDPRDALIESVGQRWRLSNDEITHAAWARRHESLVRSARAAPWPRLQRILIRDEFIEELLALAEAVARVLDGSTEEIAFCRAKLALPPEERNPPPLLTGNDLIRAGLTPGPAFHVILEAVRDAQLEGQIHTKEEALEYALALWRKLTSGGGGATA
jgi:hypothetical protein